MSRERDPVLILTGAPGAGKTTAARLLAEREERGVHLEVDRFFDFIRSGYVEPWRSESHKQNELVMAVVGRAAAAYAAAGYFTIVDGIVVPEWFFEPLRDALREAGNGVAYAVLRPSLEVCQSRAAAQQSGRLSDPDVVARLWREFSELGQLERHAIDCEGLTPDKTAELLRRRLGDELMVR